MVMVDSILRALVALVTKNAEFYVIPRYPCYGNDKPDLSLVTIDFGPEVRQDSSTGAFAVLVDHFKICILYNLRTRFGRLYRYSWLENSFSTFNR